jgi:hypothetical protein
MTISMSTTFVTPLPLTPRVNIDRGRIAPDIGLSGAIHPKQTNPNRAPRKVRFRRERRILAVPQRSLGKGAVNQAVGLDTSEPGLGAGANVAGGGHLGAGI